MVPLWTLILSFPLGDFSDSFLQELHGLLCFEVVRLQIIFLRFHFSILTLLGHLCKLLLQLLRSASIILWLTLLSRVALQENTSRVALGVALGVDLSVALGVALSVVPLVDRRRGDSVQGRAIL